MVPPATQNSARKCVPCTLSTTTPRVCSTPACLWPLLSIYAHLTAVDAADEHGACEECVIKLEGLAQGECQQRHHDVAEGELHEDVQFMWRTLRCLRGS